MASVHEREISRDNKMPLSQRIAVTLPSGTSVTDTIERVKWAEENDDGPVARGPVTKAADQGKGDRYHGSLYVGWGEIGF